MEYDFKSLSDYDLELLVCDLLSAEWGRTVEGFRRGRDQGIDLRCAMDGDGRTVIQCKHYAATPFSGLCAAVRREYPKIQHLSPERYLLVTSQFLTPAEKETLLALLTPFCRSGEDILGGSELNSLLRRHSAVERAHYKLWLTSAAVMEKILHSELYQQSAMLRAEIYSKLCLYVQSAAAYNKAQETLRRQNCCIISGIPGIGKTTLAEILLIGYLDQGYEIVKVRSDVREAIAAYAPGRKQVFFYDDFLGSTALELRDGKNEGENLLSLLSYIAKDSGKKFILTTREYILNQARQRIEAFDREDFDYRKCVISLEDYTRSDRARILYNHLYFYRAARADVADLLKGNRVISIVDHPNYSPRLIETVIKLRRPAGEEGFYQFFTRMLDHPNKLWEHAFQRQISPAARDLLLLLCPVQDSADLSYLRECYEVYHSAKARLENRSLRVTDFMDALRETEGTFVQINGRQVSYHNPSVRDFIHGYIEENDAEFRVLCETAMDFDYCLQLMDLDPTLCRRHLDACIPTLRRVIMEHRRGVWSFVLTERIRRLVLTSRYHALTEVQEVIQDALARLLDLIEAQSGDMSAENCHDRVSPSALKDLLAALIRSPITAEERDRLHEVFLRYALAWYEWAFSYSIDDLLFLPAFHKVYDFPVEEETFCYVYDLLEDFRNDCAYDQIQSIEYAGECEDYMDGLDELEEFFRVDLSYVRGYVDEREEEIRRLEEDSDDDDWEADAPPSRDLLDAEITSMFYTLLDREDGE